MNVKKMRLVIHFFLAQHYIVQIFVGLTAKAESFLDIIHF